MDAYLLALDHGQADSYNVGTDRFGTLRQALEQLILYAHSSSELKSLPEGPAIRLLGLLDALRLSPLAPWHYLTYHKPFYFDRSKLLDLGWKPRFSNDEMFRESYDWFLSNCERLRTEKAGSPHRRTVREGLLWLVKKLS
jgi:nucleoside-diphosphate-sugar epimerase